MFFNKFYIILDHTPRDFLVCDLWPNPFNVFYTLKPHLHGRLFCNAIRRFFMRENLSRRAVTHTRRDSLAAIMFGKNRRRVSNTCDLRCRLYSARLDARIVLDRDHLHEVDFNVSRVPRQSRSRVNSKSYAIYESPRHSAMNKCFASRWLRLSKIYLIKYCIHSTKESVVLLL